MICELPICTDHVLDKKSLNELTVCINEGSIVRNSTPFARDSTDLILHAHTLAALHSI